MLTAFYRATGGPNWEDDTNWLTNESLDSWYGVATADGRVTRLNLGGNRLTGEIPPELGNLTQLTELWLGDDNHLTGDLPTELSRLTKLQVLDLGYSEISGAIPSWLGDMRDLRLLYLDNNDFSGQVPDELGNLTGLGTIDSSRQPWSFGSAPGVPDEDHRSLLADIP